MATTKTTKQTFTDDEKAAMKARAKELKAEAKRGEKREQGTAAVREAIAAMPEPDRSLAERIHAIVESAAPQLVPKTWYGMPAWADDDGKVVCYFKGASKFSTRYAQFGFEEAARLDDGTLWTTVFAVTKIDGAVEKRLHALVERAVS
jgi:uncharacterized protein YdhG (YjbR/CyaY superfamily)